MRIIVLFLLVPLFAGCSVVRVKHHWGFMGPDTWEATDGKVSIYSYRGSCWNAEQMLQSLADKANRGELDWSKMADPEFRDKTLSEDIYREICQQRL